MASPSSSSSSSATNTGVTPWSRTEEFLAATTTVVPPGSLAAYARPRPVGATFDDVTGFVVGQAAWTDDNWPDVMYLLHPPPGWDEFRRSPPQPRKRDANGKLILGIPFPDKKAKGLRDYKILPDRIGTRNPWWYYEAIRRIDPRVCWSDILMRMPLAGRRNQNALNMENSRMRERYHMICWHPGTDPEKENLARQRVLSKLTPQQIAANSTRGSTPGLIDPLLGEAGGRVPHPILRNGQGSIRGSRPTKSKPSKMKVKKTKARVDTDGESEKDEDDVKSDAEQSLGVGPRRPSCSHPHILSTSTQASTHAYSPYIEAHDRRPGVDGRHVVKKRKRVVDDDEDLDPRANHLRQRRRDPIFTRTPVRDNRTIVDDIPESEDYVESQYEVTERGRTVHNHFAGPSAAQIGGRRPSRLAAGNLQSSQRHTDTHAEVRHGIATPEELDIVLRQLSTPYREPELEDLNKRNRPIQQPPNSRQVIENTSTRYMNYSSAPLGGGRSLQLTDSHFLPSNREYGQSAATIDSSTRPHGSRSSQVACNHSVQSDRRFGQPATTRRCSLRTDGDQFLQTNGSYSVPPYWDHDQPAPTASRAIYDTPVASTEVFHPTSIYGQNMPPSQPVQDDVPVGPIYAAASDFDFDTIQREASSRYPSPPCMLSECSASSRGSQLGAVNASLGQEYPTWAYPSDDTAPGPSDPPND